MKRLWMFASVLLWLLSFSVSPMAEEPSSATGEITLVFSKTDTVFHLYRIGEITGEYKAVFLPEYQNLGYDLSDSDQWEEIVNVLGKIVRKGKIHEDCSVELRNHKGTIGNVPLGVYLVIGEERKEDNTIITPAPFLLSLPEWDGKEYTRNLWIDFVKYTSRKEDVLLYRLVKQWNNDKEEERPKEITVDIYHGYQKVNTVRLNKDNQWTYCWKGERDEEDWHVRESIVPHGYRQEIFRQCNENEIVFVITNTKIQKESAPNTGDHINVEPYVFVILCALISAMIAGAILLATRDEDRR